MANFIFYMYKRKNRIAACYMDSNISSTLPSQRREKYNWDEKKNVQHI